MTTVAARTILLLSIAVARPVLADANLAAFDLPADAIRGSAEQRREIVHTFAQLGAVVAHPERFPALRTPSLEVGECNTLVTGLRSCNFWASVRDDDGAMPLRSLYVLAARVPGDHGGSAFWNIADGVCLRTPAVLRIATDKPTALPVYPIESFVTEPDTVRERRAYLLADLNPGWGKVDLRLMVHDGCVVSLGLDAARR